MGTTRRSGIYHGIALLGLLGAMGALPGHSASGSTSGSSSIDWRAMGHMWSASGTLRPGCRHHTYHYRVTPPSSTWSLETFLVGPRGKHLASDVVISGADRRSGTKSFTICKADTQPGRFTIKGKLTYSDYPAQPSGWISPTHFRLRRP